MLHSPADSPTRASGGQRSHEKLWNFQADIQEPQGKLHSARGHLQHPRAPRSMEKADGFWANPCPGVLLKPT